MTNLVCYSCTIRTGFVYVSSIQFVVCMFSIMFNIDISSVNSSQSLKFLELVVCARLFSLN